MRKILKIAAAVLLALLFTGALLVLTLYLRGDLHRHAQAALIRIIADNLDARIELGRLSGSLLQTLQLEQVRLFRAADTLVQVDTLRCRWRPLGLLLGRITLTEIEVSGARIALRQYDDKSWNAQHYRKASKGTRGPDWTVVLNTIRLHQTELSLQPAGSRETPQRVIIPILAANARISPANWQIELEEAHMELLPLGLAIVSLQARAAGDHQKFALEGVRLATQDSRLSGYFKSRADRKPGFAARLELDSLAMGDLESIIGRSLPLDKAKVRVEAIGSADSINLDLRAAAPQGSVQLAGWIKPQGMASAQLVVTDLKSDDLFGMPGLLVAGVDFSGEGFSLKQGKWRAQGWLHHSLFDRISLERLLFSARLDSGRLKVALDAPAARGGLKGSADFLLETTPSCTLQLAVNGLDLAPLTDRPSLASDLNLELQISGEGSSPADARGRIRLRSQSSIVAGFGIDSFLAAGEVRGGAYSLDTLQLSAPGLRATGRGSWRQSGPLAFLFDLRLKDHRALAPLLNADSLRLTGAVQGRIAGSLDSLRLQATARLGKSTINSVLFDNLAADISALLTERMQGTMDLASGPVRAGETTLADSLEIHGRLAGRSLTTKSTIAWGDSTRLRFACQADDQDSLWQITLPEAEVQHNLQIWRLEGGVPQLTLRPDRLALSGLALIDGRQRFEMGGTLALDDSLSFHIDLENLELAPWTHSFSAFRGVSGGLSWRAAVSGIASDPHLLTTLRIEDLKVAGLPSALLQLSGTLQDSLLVWDGAVTQGPDVIMNYSGRLPLRLSWPLPEKLIAAQDPLEIALRTRNLQAGILSGFLPELDLKGSISGDLTVSNSWQDPKPAGYLELRNGSLVAPFLGKPYKSLEARLELSPSRLTLSRLQATGGEGRLSGEGYWQIDLDQQGLRFHDMQLRINADRFTAADGAELTLVLNGNLELTDNLIHPKLNGHLRVERARVDLAAFTETPSTLLQADLPLLMVARGDTARQSYDREILLPAWMPLVERLRGSVRVEIPRNSWLRSPEMNIEISGDLDLAKEGDNFGLFGAIEIVRGNYDLFSHRFDIDEGTLTFTGGDNLPEMSLQATHLFRTPDKVKHTLALSASGELRKPLFSFTLDDAAIAEADAVSYLAFGRSFADLTHGEKTDLAQNQLAMSGEAFKQLLAGQIAGEVSRSLQQTLDLDVIEFRGDQDWRQSTVVVGKYLTNDLYMSYERQLNLGHTDEVVPEQVTLEYEILRSLFLQASRGDEKNTGFDLIFKWEK
jgi:translocation and assembly module TamB